MSDILINDMEMPKNCKDCRFWLLFLGRYLCFAQNIDVSNYTFEFMSQNRLPNCPLVEVPTPHGDLIDKQKVVKELGKAWNVDDDQDFCNKSVWRIVERESETVIEAST